jgi:hydrogenase maturation protease
VSAGQTVVIGIGNELRGDDAAGLEAARGAAREHPGLQTVELDGEPSRLLDAWDGVEHAILIDACSGIGEPGEVHRFDAASEPLPAALGRGSTHALGLSDAIELARALGRLPARVTVFAVEARNFVAGSEMSPIVREAAARAGRTAGAEALAALDPPP